MKTNTQQELAKKLRMLREFYGLSLTEAGEKVHVSYRTMWDYENTRSAPPLDMIVAFADLYQVSVDYLLGHEDVQNNSHFLDVTGLTEEERGAMKIIAKSLSGENARFENPEK